MLVVGDDRIERCCRLDVGPANQKLSQRESEERAHHVEREDPPASHRSALALSQLSVVMSSPAQPKPITARRTSQASGPIKRGMAAVAVTTSQAKGSAWGCESPRK